MCNLYDNLMFFTKTKKKETNKNKFLNVKKNLSHYIDASDGTERTFTNKIVLKLYMDISKESPKFIKIMF